MNWAHKVDLAYTLEECELTRKIKEKEDLVERSSYSSSFTWAMCFIHKCVGNIL